MKKIVHILFFITLLFSINSTVVFSKEPNCLLLKAQGEIEYSKDGIKWKKINRNKFLFEGYYVRTGSNGLCMLLNHKTNYVREMKKNSKVMIKSKDISVISGVLSESKFIGTLTGGLSNKFIAIHNYTTVIRSVPSRSRIKLYTINSITLSNKYPYLVWKNIGDDYLYRLIIGKKSIDVPASPRDMIRFKLEQITQGEYKYKIQVLNNNGQILYDPNKMKILKWLSKKEDAEIEIKRKKINDLFNSNFITGSYLDDQGLKVAAMDYYHEFFLDNPNNFEMMPFLIKIYEDLKLTDLKTSLLKIYNNRIFNFSDIVVH